MDYLENLNDKQKEAVLYGDGALLILAGAGSGKTRVLTYRIANLINERLVSPYNIIAITFTNKAAKEMKERLRTLLGNMADNLWISTFHSACVRMLRRDIERLGYDKNFIIFDSADQKTLVKDCLKELNLDEKVFPPKSVLGEIGKAKDELIEPENFKKIWALDYRMSKIASVYQLYQKRLRESNSLDFDDIISLTIKLLLENDDIASYYQNKFKYVLVDEYQDTNVAQYSFISILAQLHKNLCVVGDDDQSIYGWRGANVQNILNFEKEFNNCKVIKLEQNYRSTSVILDAANAVIKNNLSRKAKELWTEKTEGEKISKCEAMDEREEALFVAAQIKKMYQENDKKYSDFAVLYRINAQSRVVEEVFIREGIPYKIFGGLKFYDRKEIKDLIAYLRVIQNPLDRISLKRIINTPKRGIGNTTITNLESISLDKNIGMYSVMSVADQYIELKRSSVKLMEFVDMLNKISVQKDEIRISELIQMIIDRTGMVREYQTEDSTTAKTRIENIEELLSVAVEFESKSEDVSLSNFLEHIALVADIDSYEEETDNVVLMTLHSAKGLEFPVVYMVGVEEGIFPGYRTMTEESLLEEERRLCYVGITRACEKLYVTCARQRTLFGNTSFNRASRFLSEIPQELIEGQQKELVKQKVGNLKEYTENYAQKASSYFKTFTINKTALTEGFDVGESVTHKKFGNGVITLSEKYKDDIKLEINFENFGMKRLMARYAGLTKI